MGTDFFNSDSYDTPESTRRSRVDRLFLGSRWYFYFNFVRKLLKLRPYVKKNEFDDAMYFESSFSFLKDMEKMGARIHLRGLHNIKKYVDEPVIFLSNHMSTTETLLFPCLIGPHRPSLAFVVKESLASLPLFGKILQSRDPILVGQKDPYQDMQTVLGESKRNIEKGRSVVLFPEGERNTRFNPEAFSSLGVRLARQAGAKIIPVALKTDFWGTGRLVKELGPIKRKERIHMVFGEPIEIKGNGKKEHKDVVDFISYHTRKWNVFTSNGSYV